MRSDQAQGSPLCPSALLLWEHVPPENRVPPFLFVPYLIHNNIFIYFVPPLLPVEEQGTEAGGQKRESPIRHSSLPSILFLPKQHQIGKVMFELTKQQRRGVSKLRVAARQWI
jgi:hypothetical protein